MNVKIESRVKFYFFFRFHSSTLVLSLQLLSLLSILVESTAMGRIREWTDEWTRMKVTKERKSGRER